MTRAKFRYLVALACGRVCVACGSAVATMGTPLEECFPCWDKRTSKEEAEWANRYNR